MRLHNRFMHAQDLTFTLLSSVKSRQVITKTCLFKYTENFTTETFSNIFHISAQNIYCGYSLEPPRRGGSNEYSQSMFLSRNKKKYTSVNFSFYYIKVGFKGVKIL